MNMKMGVVFATGAVWKHRGDHLTGNTFGLTVLGLPALDPTVGLDGLDNDFG